MKKTSLLLLFAVLGILNQNVEARLYRWVDEHGNVQYGDRTPPAEAKSVTELDQRGMVRKTAEKPVSAEEIAQRTEKRQAELMQKRQDKALLDSFSSPAEIDALRDRQIGAVEARQQTNQAQIREAQSQLTQWTAQADMQTKKQKTVPESLALKIESARKEVARLQSESQKIAAEIAALTERAETDKKRFIELRGQR